MPTNEKLRYYTRNLIVDYRKTHGLSQEKMAEILNISTRAYSNIERGKFCCSLETFINYLIVLNVDLNKLIEDLKDFYLSNDN
ncbi:MAG: helix-turn-helix domain-containing protein [Eubacterium sp.]|nr:helix-turn-helix domain-containing protein [Eubacterium sp.]